MKKRHKKARWMRTLALLAAGALVGGMGQWAVERWWAERGEELPSNMWAVDEDKALDLMRSADRECTLSDAALRGNVRVLLSKSESQDLQRTDENGYTLMHLAAMAGHEAVIYILQRAGVNPLARAKDGKRAVDVALNGETREACRYAEQLYLLERQALKALRSGREQELMALLHDGVNPNAAHAGKPMLYMAAELGMSRAVQEIAFLGADLKACYKGKNALFIAVRKDYPKIVSLLASQGMSLTERAADGSYTLHEAINASSHNSLLFLLPYFRYADYKAYCPQQGYPAEAAVAHGKIYGLNLMIQNGLNPNDAAYTPPLLMQAVKHKQTEIVQLLLRNGADPAAAGLDPCDSHEPRSGEEP